MKKFLSLVLALVMTMSLVTISAGAEDFTDDSSITYEEAVDVVSAAGIVSGYENGSFNPQGSLTRGAAAKIICNMILGPTTAEALSADTAPFSDVSVNHTFAGYIAYCAKEGIISGYADGTFRPAAPLTGYAFMKMLLGALGYDAGIEGYVGANWSINVAKRALSIELDDGLKGSFVGTKALNREEAALYAFNTLCATMVDYDNNTTITVGDTTIVTSTKAQEVTSGDTDAIWDEVEDDDANYCTLQFAEKYFDDLDVEPTTDDFGRPATKWYWDDEKVGTYADEADKVYVIDDDDDDLEYALVDVDAMNYDDEDVLSTAKVWFNGYNGTEKDPITYTDRDNVEVLAGDTIEAFENSKGDVTSIVVSRYIAAEIDEIDTDLGTNLTKKGATYEVSLTKVDTADNIPVGPFYDDHSDSKMVMKGFDAETYEEGTVLAVAFKFDGETYTDVVLGSYVAEQATALITSYTADYVKADGEKYIYAAEVDGVTPGSVTYSDDDEYEIYVDANGFAIAIVGAGLADLDDVYYVVGTYGADGSYGGTTYYAQAIHVMTGVVSELKLETKHGELASVGTAWSTDKEGLYVMTDDKIGNDCKSNNDKYNAAKFESNADWDVIVGTGLADDIESDDTSIKVTVQEDQKTSTSRYYLNSKTFFVSAEDVKGDLAVATATGVMKMSENDPDYVAIIAEQGKNKASYVVLAGKDLGTAVSTDDVVYLQAGQDFDQNTNDDTTNAALWFMETMTAEEVVLDGLYDDSERGFYVYSIDSDDLYELEDKVKTIEEQKKDVVDDEITGYELGLTITEDNYNDDNHLLSVGTYIDDVSYADAKIVDGRGDSAKKADAYTGTIATVSALERAIDKGETVIDIYVEDGEITFIVVLEVADAAPAV